MKKYLTDYPDLLSEFHPTKNGGLKPENLTYGSSKKVWWTCNVEESHNWETSVAHRTNGRGCPYCSGRKSSKNIRNEKLKKLGWSMLDEYERNSVKTNFQCLRCNNVVSSTYMHISSQHKKCKCKIYEKHHQNWSLEAKNRGGKLLTPYYIGGGNTKYLWSCERGHQWESSILSVIRQKSWCNECRGFKKRTFQELQKIVDERDGVLLTTKYLGTEGSYEFRCNLGHYFKNTFRHIVDRGQWCPTCSKGTKTEEMVRCALEQIFGDEFSKLRPKWLKNSRKRQMELDGYNEKLKIAFEYQGIQHFEEKGFFYDKTLCDMERKKLLKLRIDDDKTKVRLCKENNVKLFVLTYEDAPEKFLDVITNQATELGIELKNYDFTSPIDFSQTYIRNDRLSELKQLLLTKNITVLSDKWISSDTKYELKCEVCSFTWSAQGNAFFNSRSVAGCRKCGHSRKSEKQKLGMDFVVAYAQKFGGKVLSKTYVRRNYVYEFECSEGHQFKKNFNNMVYRQQFCPFCEELIIRKAVKYN